jgi:hypothetical protein
MYGYIYIYAPIKSTPKKPFNSSKHGLTMSYKKERVEYHNDTVCIPHITRYCTAPTRHGVLNTPTQTQLVCMQHDNRSVTYRHISPVRLGKNDVSLGRACNILVFLVLSTLYAYMNMWIPGTWLSWCDICARTQRVHSGADLFRCVEFVRGYVGEPLVTLLNTVLINQGTQDRLLQLLSVIADARLHLGRCWFVSESVFGFCCYVISCWCFHLFFLRLLYVHLYLY